MRKQNAVGVCFGVSSHLGHQEEMADRGRLLPTDFKYRPEKAAAALANGAGLGLPEVGSRYDSASAKGSLEDGSFQKASFSRDFSGLLDSRES